MLSDEKYVVFKRAEFENWVKNLAAGEPADKLVAASALGDAVVIRKQDVFAAPGLYAYANVIQTGLDLFFMAGIHDPEMADRLEVIRDYFADQALDAGNHPRKKVPD